MEMIRDAKLSSYQYRFVSKNAEVRWVMETFTPIWYQDGRSAFAYFIELDEAKQVEQTLDEMREFSFNLLTSSHNPVLVINPDTSIRYVNPALELLTGFNQSELIGQKPPYPWWTEETVDKIKNDSELIVLNTEFADAKEKGTLWATFVELELIIKGLPKLIAFCFDYMPSSVEILKPEEFSMKNSTIENLINDLQARLHQVDMIVKQQKNENEFLKQNLNKSVSNTILISLAPGSLDKEKLSKVTGIASKELEILLDRLIKEILSKFFKPNTNRWYDTKILA